MLFTAIVATLYLICPVGATQLRGHGSGGRTLSSFGPSKKITVAVKGGDPTCYTSITAISEPTMRRFYNFHHEQDWSLNSPLDANGDALEELNSGNVLVAAVETLEGTGIMVVYDAIEDGSGGRAVSHITCPTGSCGSFPTVHDFLTASDDHHETAIQVGNKIVARHTWYDCCTDGYGTGPLAPGDTLCVKFKGKVRGLDAINIFELEDGVYKSTSLTDSVTGNEICFSLGCEIPVCTNDVDHGGMDSECTATAPICVGKDMEYLSASAPGYSCAVCVNSYSVGNPPHIDFGCTEAAPICALADSSHPMVWNAGTQCIAT